jgi:hypothetical protein
MYVYYVTHISSGRNRSFGAQDWADVESQLCDLGLDPDDWAITSIQEV